MSHPSDSLPDPAVDQREMFDEINALIKSVAAAIEISEGEVVQAIERGELGMEMLTDEAGANYLRIQYGEKTADLRQGVFIRHER